MKKIRNLVLLTGIVCTVSLAADSALADAPGFFKKPGNPTTLNGTGNLSIQAIASATSSFPLTFYWYKTNTLVYTTTTNANNLGSTYVISNALPPDAGSYSVTISNSLGTTSAVFTVTIKNPYLAVSPNSLSSPEGSSTNLTSLALGTAPIDYYWYKRIAGVSTNVVSTGSSNLVFAPLVRTNGGIYFVVASNTWGAVTSSTVTLTVNFKPAITNIVSTNIVAEVNSYAYSTVQYEASPNPSLYWFKDGVYQPTLSGSSLSISPVQTTNAGSYQLVVSNFLGSVTSAPIVLTVLPARGPTITNQPVDRVVAVNGTLNLNVLADGSPTMYSGLFKEGSGQLGSWTYGFYFSVTMTNTSQSGNYYIIVTNNYGSATSELASVTVLMPQPASVSGKQFVKIADSTMQAPGLGTNLFNSFRDAFIVNGQIWFGGGVGNVPFSAGIYHWSNNVIESLVNTNNSIPGGSGTFGNFYGSTYLSDGKVIFDGRSGGQNGIYAWTNGTIIKLYDTNTVMPGQSFAFEDFGWPTVFSNQLAFLGIQTFGGTNEYRAVYISSNNVLTKLADTNDILPDVGHFRGSSSQVAFDGNKVAWWGVGETGQGIYTVSRTAPIAAVATTSTLNPASGANFIGLVSPPDSVPGVTYFTGYSDSFYTSFFSYDSGGLHLVAKPGDSMPGRGVPFRYVGYPGFAASPTGVFYSGLDSSGFGGIYYWDGTSSTKIIDSLDTLDGLEIQYAYIADADADNIVFYIGFKNGLQALYALMPASGQTFSEWTSQYTFPAGQSDPEDDADGDGLPNIFEYYFDTNPTNSASGSQPAVANVNVAGTNYPAITFVRSQSAIGVTLIPQVSSSVLFADSLGSTVESVVDLGNGTERVTIRSNVSIAAQSTQFLRIGLTVP